MATDKELLEKFKKVMKVSNRIKKSDAAKMMKISHDKLLDLIFEWGEELSVKIEEDIIVVDNISNFTDGIDAMFMDWESKEVSGEGKVEKFNNLITSSRPLTKKRVIQKTSKSDNSPSLKATPPEGINNEYNGVPLVISDIQVLLKIEELMGGKKIPHVNEMKKKSFGFKTKNKRVIGLGLYKKNLPSLPESIGGLKKLTELYLHENHISIIPQSVGNLTNLAELYLNDNHISSLPNAIGNFKNLTKLNLSLNQLTNLPESIINFLSYSDNGKI